MTFGRDQESFCHGLSNGERGRLAWDGLPSYADDVDRALCLAGFEMARITAGRGAYPVLIHSGRRAYWLAGNDSSDLRGYRPRYQVTMPGERPSGDSGYYCLRGIFGIKGESQHGSRGHDS